MKKFKFIDLFCGIGGFHQAMKSLGGECVFASDIDDDCRKTYEANYGIVPVGDITKIDANLTFLRMMFFVADSLVRHSQKPVIA